MVKVRYEMYESNNVNDSITDIMNMAWDTLQNLGVELVEEEIEPYLAIVDNTELGKIHIRHCMVDDSKWKQVCIFTTLMDNMDTDWTWEIED